MTDPAEIRAEGRRLRELIRTERTAGDTEAARQAVKDFSWLMLTYADVLLADPAPVGLTEVRMDMAGDALMTAWAIIANAWEGDWSQAPNEWRAAAERWRDEDFHPLLDALNAQEADHHG